MDRCSLYGNPCIRCKPGPCSSRVRIVESERKTEPPKYEGKWANDLDHKAMSYKVISVETLLEPPSVFGWKLPDLTVAVSTFERAMKDREKGDREVLNKLIRKLKAQRDKAAANPCTGLKEEVVLNKVLCELNELQVNMEIRDRILRENLEMAIANYFIKHIQDGHDELDPVDTNADIQKIVRECLWLQKESAI